MMYCKKCGAQLEDDAVFCNKCGAKLEAKETDSQNAVKPAGSGMVKSNSAEPKSNKGKLPLGKIIPIVLVVVAIFVVIGILKSNAQKISLDPEKIVLITAEGYDGYGTAKITVDKEVIENAIDEKNSDITEKQKSTFLGSVSVTASETSNLSNGQEITLTLKYNEDIAKENKISFTKDEWEYKFGDSDFDEIKKIDPFSEEYITASFTGVSPSARAEFQTYPVNSEIGTLYYVFDKTDNLKIGDTITVTCKSDEDSLVKRGYALTEKEHTYTITESDVDLYIESPDMIDEDSLASMKKEAEDIINKALVDYEEKVTMGDLTFEGVAVRSAKGEVYSNHNFVYLIYSLDCTSLSDPNSDEFDIAGSYFDPLTLYFPIEFRDVVKYRDGTITPDYIEKNLPNTDVAYDYWWGWKYLKGYKDAKSMFTEIIRKYTDSYNYALDSNVEKLF